MVSGRTACSVSSIDASMHQAPIKLSGIAHVHIAEEVGSPMAPLEGLWIVNAGIGSPSTPMPVQRKLSQSINQHLKVLASVVARALEMMSSWSATWDLQVLQL